MSADSSFDFLRFGMASVAGGAGLYLAGWRGMRRRWVIQNIPTSKVRSVAMGQAELIGKARAIDTPLTSPVRGLPSVWYRVKVTRETGSGKNRRVQVVFKQEIGVPFELDDGTGRILVDPKGAEVTGIVTCDMEVSSWSVITGETRAFCDRIGISGRTGCRIREWVVMTDAETYVLGDVGKTRDAAAERRKQMTVVLREWLKSPERKAAIDTDGDGKIDQAEWEAARAQAHMAVLKDESAAPAGPAIAVRKPRHGYFLIAAGGEKAALKAQGYPAFLVTGGVVLVGAGVGMLEKAGAIPPALWLLAALMVAIGGWQVFRHFRS